ncbi:unnamed protein product [Peronospora belbahrii]|uniref:Uncharacterized protein n=1 Tax=Peronospora belbahrii TaxID=622444 RepID=A0AAU9L5J9_9STRA|nr:unnamed protein product [Peronospora belbahrii]
MASSGLKNGTTMESDMEQQQYEHQRGIQEKDQIIEEKDASDERKIVIVNETHTVVETAEMLTVKELQKVATMKEHNISEDFEATVCLSADAMEEIAETIAMNDNGSVEMDYSVAATLGSSVDEESVKTEDFAEENTFIEESSKDAEVDFAELAAADESIEKMNELTAGESTETMKAMKQVYNTSKAVETKEISSAMTCSVDATLGRSVDADSVLYLDDMRGSTNVDGQETTDVSVEQAMSKSAAILIHSAENNAPIKVVATETDVTSQEPVAEERSVDVTKKMKSVYKVEPVIEEASDEVLISETKGTAEIDQCVTAVAIGTTSDSCEVDTANATLTEAPSEMIDSFHASTDLINSAFAIPNTATEESEHPNTATEESEKKN